MPVIFQKNISDSDINSNPEIFYALSGGERHTTGTEQILYIHNMKNIRTPWTDEYYVTNKFGNYGGYSKLKEDDPFGYLAQGYGYSKAENVPFGGWIAVNKSTGEWSICEAPNEQEEEKQIALKKASDNVKSLMEDKPFKKLFEPKDEKIKIKGEDIFTGNKIMPTACSFCSYKYHCWPKAELHKKVATRAVSRPMVWYTKLKEKDLENCL